MTKTSSKKVRSRMKSFEAAPDVSDMIECAISRGLKVTWICNSALRMFLRKEGYARKKDLTETV